MSLATSKTQVNTDYTAARNVVIAVTDQQITDGLAGLSSLAVNVSDALTLLRARQDLLSDPRYAADIDIIATWSQSMSSYTEGIRTLIHNIQAKLPA